MLLPRSFWTSRPTTSSLPEGGLGFFTDPTPPIQFIPVGAYQPFLKDTLFYYRNPAPVLNNLVKDAFQVNLPDIPFNYCITQNIDAIFTVSGRMNKYGEAIRVLMLIGDNEKPTDVIKKNQKLLKETYLDLSNVPPGPGTSGHGVHTFDLIECLIEHGVYRNRNCSDYDAFTEHGVKLLQDRYGLPVTGTYDEYLYKELYVDEREYIKVAQEI